MPCETLVLSQDHVPEPSSIDTCRCVYVVAPGSFSVVVSLWLLGTGVPFDRSAKGSTSNYQIFEQDTNSDRMQVSNETSACIRPLPSDNAIRLSLALAPNMTQLYVASVALKTVDNCLTGTDINADFQTRAAGIECLALGWSLVLMDAFFDVTASSVRLDVFDGHSYLHTGTTKLLLTQHKDLEYCSLR